MKPLIDYIPIYSRRLSAAVRAFNAPANASKTLSERFACAAAVMKASEEYIVKHMVSVPYRYLVELFGFKGSAYMTVPHEQFTAMKYMGMNANDKTDIGPGRVLYADPNLYLRPPNMETIYADNNEENIRTSAAILASEDKIYENHRELIVIIRDEFSKEEDMFKVSVFAMRGVALPDGAFQFDQIVMPSYDPATGEVGPKYNVDTQDHDAVSKALAFAVKCRDALLQKRELRLSAFLSDVARIPYSSRALPGVAQLPGPTATPAAAPG